MTKNQKSHLFGFIFLLAALAVVEFWLLPFLFNTFIHLAGNQSYLAGLLVLVIPRALLVLVVSIAVLRFWPTRWWLYAILAYAILLVVKYQQSEVYVQPSNVIALFTSLAPYAAGLLALVLAFIFVRYR